MKGLSKGRYDETFAGEDGDFDANQKISPNPLKFGLNMFGSS